MATAEFLLDADELAESVEKAMSAAADAPTPPAPSDEPSHYLAITVMNLTQFVLTPADNYFDSGKFFQAPSAIMPFQRMTFSVSAKDPSLAGVSGAVTFTLNPAPNVVCRFGVGFSNPVKGSNTSNAAFDADHNQATNSNPVLNPISLFTQGTYNGNSQNTTTATSAMFTGADRQGASITIQFDGSAVPGAQATASIVQKIVSGGQ